MSSREANAQNLSAQNPLFLNLRIPSKADIKEGNGVEVRFRARIRLGVSLVRLG